MIGLPRPITNIVLSILKRDAMPHSTLNSFSDLAQETSSQLRNCANEPSMRAWFEALFLEKFDGEDERAQKAWAWCATVGRKHMLREGASLPFIPEPAGLASGPAWIMSAVAARKPLTKLSLEPSERELFSSILDWMRSSSGPALSSDWSRISVAQAKSAELGWIDAMAKAAAKKDLDAADAAGTEIFIELGRDGPQGAGLASGPHWAGWRWVEVKSSDALAREGSLMRHCVESYATDVAAGQTAIFSLRDPLNVPKLTVEAEGAELVQIKAFANASCPAELRPAVAAFAQGFEAYAAARGLGAASASDELREAGVGSLPGLGLFVAELSAAQASTLRGWAAEAAKGSDDANDLLNTLAPSLAILGLAPELSMVLRFLGETRLRDASIEAATNGHAECLLLLIDAFASQEKRSEALLSALKLAARNGSAECVKLLIPITDLKADDSLALTFAASNGHAECVKLLIPGSDARASNAVALRVAAARGHAECLELLINASEASKDSEDSEDFSQALYSAAGSGHAACVKLLLPFSDPNAYDCAALRAAARDGHAECVKLLIRASPSTDGVCSALCYAAASGHTECVKLLIPVCDLKATPSHALREAAHHGYGDCVELLLPHLDPLAHNGDGRTAQGLALKAGHHDVAAMIGRHIEHEIGAPGLSDATHKRRPELSR